MQTREGRSHAGPLSNPGRLPRKRWTRPDIARPDAVTRLDATAELPQAARRDLVAGFGERGL